MSVLGELLLLLLLPFFCVLVSPLREAVGVVVFVAWSADDDDDEMVLCLSVKVKLPHSAIVSSCRAGDGD
jgi:hypothetical protein